MHRPISTDMQVYLDRVEEEGKRSFGVSCPKCRESERCQACTLSLVFWILKHPSPADPDDWADELGLEPEETARRIGGG